MGEKFNRYKTKVEQEVAAHRQAVEIAPAQFRSGLKQSLDLFNQTPVLGQGFYLTNRGDLALRDVEVKMLSANGSFQIQFRKVHDEYETPVSLASWRLNPLMEHNQFKWRVPELGNQAFTNEELADEVAIHMTNLIKPSLQ